MRYMKWAGLAAALTLIIACFIPWVIIPWQNFTVTGIDAGEKLRSPANFHFLFTFFFLLFTFINRIWAKQWNLFIAAINLAWGIRNFFLITACQDGNCPEKKIGIYLVLFSTLIMLISTFFPDLTLNKKGKK